MTSHETSNVHERAEIYISDNSVNSNKSFAVYARVTLPGWKKRENEQYPTLSHESVVYLLQKKVEPGSEKRQS